MNTQKLDDENLEQQARNRALRATLLRGLQGMMNGGAIGSGIAVASQFDALPVIGKAIKNFDNSMPNITLATMLTSVQTGAVFPSAFILGSTVAGITMFEEYPKMLEQERAAVLAEQETSTPKNTSFAEKEAQKKAQPVKATLHV